MSLSLFTRRRKDDQLGAASQWRGALPPGPYQPAPQPPVEQDPLERLLQLERFGHVVRQYRAAGEHPMAESTFSTAVEAIDDRFALVPEGYVTLTRSTNDYPGCPEEDLETEPFLLARHCVTNAQYQKFVDDAGYGNLDLWPRDIWPHLIDFMDLTGRPAPRYWRDGRGDQRLADHPVVGICHYEAAAYAKWAGYRLPTSAQWQMAASWRIRSEAHVLRRYPWGDAFDTTKCNVWASRIGRTMPVMAYENGAAPNAVLQLVGNVWEWTDSDYEVVDDGGRPVVGDMLLKEIRGGAFDTYFPSQATSTFRTGLAALARMHDVGFRCVMDLSPNAGRRRAPDAAAAAGPRADSEGRSS